MLHTYVRMIVSIIKAFGKNGNIVCCLSAVEYEYELETDLNFARSLRSSAADNDIRFTRLERE